MCLPAFPGKEGKDEAGKGEDGPCKDAVCVGVRRMVGTVNVKSKERKESAPRKRGRAVHTLFRSIRFFIGSIFLHMGFAEGGVVLSPIVPAADSEAVGVESDTVMAPERGGVERKVRRSLGIKAKMALASSVGSPPANRTIPSAKTRFLKRGGSSVGIPR